MGQMTRCRIPTPRPDWSGTRLTGGIKGGMDELSVGDPWLLSSDVGPVIDQAARQGIQAHIEAARADGGDGTANGYWNEDASVTHAQARSAS